MRLTAISNIASQRSISPQQIEHAALGRLGLGLRLAGAERFQCVPRRDAARRVEADRFAEVGNSKVTVALHAIGDAPLMVGGRGFPIDRACFGQIRYGLAEVALIS